MGWQLIPEVVSPWDGQSLPSATSVQCCISFSSWTTVLMSLDSWKVCQYTLMLRSRLTLTPYCKSAWTWGDISWRITMAERPPNGNGLLPTGWLNQLFLNYKVIGFNIHRVYTCIIVVMLSTWVWSYTCILVRKSWSSSPFRFLFCLVSTCFLICSENAASTLNLLKPGVRTF